MTVEINEGAATCAVMVGERQVVGAIADARIITDHQASMSVLEIPGGSAHITEDDAQRLVAVGVKDDRSNVIVDD